MADLHLGKSLYGISMVDSGDQKFWIESFLAQVRELAPDVIVMAGDIYDRSAPPGEAVALLDFMLTQLEKMEIPVMMIAGNHDSGQKLSFAGSILAKRQIHIAGAAEAEILHVTVPEKDGSGEVTFWLLPYLFPAMAAQKLEDDSIGDYQTAVERLLKRQQIDFSERNVLVAHQNVTAGGREAERGGSESMVGGVGQVDYKVFDGFDYVALGHIHAACPMGRREVRYAGSPMCYHFDEARQPAKGFVFVELGKKGGDVEITQVPVKPLHPMRIVKGAADEMLDAAENAKEEGEYLKVVVTDKRITPEFAAQIRELYGRRGSVIMELISEFREFSDGAPLLEKQGEAKAIEEFFVDLYRERKAQAEPDEKDLLLFKFAADQVRGGGFSEKREERLDEDSTKLLHYILRQEALKV